MIPRHTTRMPLLKKDLSVEAVPGLPRLLRSEAKIIVTESSGLPKTSAVAHLSTSARYSALVPRSSQSIPISECSPTWLARKTTSSKSHPSVHLCYFGSSLTGQEPPAHRNIISGGSTGIVELLASGHVFRSPYPGDDAGRAQSLRDIQREFDVYQRLPRGHPRLISVVDFAPDRGITLEYMPNGSLRDWLRGPGVGAARRLRWAADAAEGVALLHAHGVVHCDVSPSNFLLDAGLRLRIIDFSGSSIDGSWSSAFESARFCLPRSWEAPSTVGSDLFALGSTAYEILTGLAPYEELADEEVELLFRKGQFPAMDGLPGADVILGCWCCKYESAVEVWAALKELAENCTT